MPAETPQKSILIVDDEELVRKTALSVLWGLVDVCHEAENGRQAVEQVKQLRFYARDEWSSSRLRNSSDSALYKEIIFFAVDDSGDARRAAHALGADAFVAKSEGPLLIQTVKRLLT